MASYKAILNPFTGKLTLIRADSAFHLKDSVATYNDLPLTGNTENDVRIAQDTDKMYTWGISATSGLITDWKEIGTVSTIDWSAVTNKPSSSTSDIDDAVSKKHTQNTDTKLDEGGANETVVADVKDAVDKKHSHTNKSELDLVTDGDHDVRTDNPHSVDKSDVGLANVTNNAQVKKSASSTDDTLPKWKGTSGDELEDSSVTEADAADAVSKKHDRQHAIDASADHTSTITENNLIDADANGLPDDSGLSVSDTSDAISKKHTQNTDETINLEDQPSSDETATGIKGTFVAGENVVFGEVCYMKSDSKFWKADADAESTGPAIAMALASINADASGSFLFHGLVRDDTWNWTVGGKIYLDTAAGALTQTAPSGSGDIVQVVGVATHADRIYFNPSLVQVEIS